MPHPGLRVATDPRFDGKLRDIESSFKDHLKTFVPLLLSPSNIEVKKISGNPLKCKELVGFFRAYLDIFKVSVTRSYYGRYCLNIVIFVHTFSIKNLIYSE